MAWDERDEEGQGGSFEYNFTVVSSRAGFTEYNEGNTALLILEGEAEFDNGNIIDKHLWISTPRPAPDAEGKWSATDDGFFFVHTANEDARFDRKSKIQRFIASALKAGVPLKKRGENSLDARAWAGLKLRIQEKEESFPNAAGETITYTQPLVKEFLGEVEGAKGLKSVPKAKGSSNGDASSDDLIGKAKALAKAAGDYVDYMDKGSKELGLPLDHAVFSEEFYSSAVKG